MKILSIIKGFVTNSSSANYWLNDGSSTTTPATQTNTKINQEGSFESFLVWILFSIILIIVFLKKKIKPKTVQWLWLNTAIISLITFTLLSSYLAIRRGHYDLYIANKVFSSTAFVLIGLSYSLSGLAHFWKIFNKTIPYKKYFGLSGLSFAIIHVTSTTGFLEYYFPTPNFFLENILSIILSTTALIIFLLMASISNQFALEKLKHWQRKIFHFGFLAYILIIFHFAILKYQIWIDWFKTFDPPMPSLTLLLVIFGLFVIGIRVAKNVSIKKSKK